MRYWLWCTGKETWFLRELCFLRESMKIYVEWEIRFPGVLIHRLLKEPIKLK